MITIGIIMMISAATLSIIAMVLFHYKGKRLNTQLEIEFGKQRRIGEK